MASGRLLVGSSEVGDGVMKERIWDGEFGAVGLDKVATFDMLLQFQVRNCGADAGRFREWVGQEGLGV